MTEFGLSQLELEKKQMRKTFFTLKQKQATTRKEGNFGKPKSVYPYSYNY